MDEVNLCFVHYYIKSKNKKEFFLFIKASHNFNQEFSNKLYSELDLLIHNCNLVQSKSHFKLTSLNVDKQWEKTYYCIYNKVIIINYGCARVKKLIHPQFQHLEIKNQKQSIAQFHIDLINNEFQLFLNKKLVGSYSQDNYHLLQGQFAFKLLNILTDTVENEWLGTFHASTISYKKEGIMLIGDSGKGKSTLAALLVSNGFNLVADDFTPIIAFNQKIHSFPSAISIKEGSIEVLNHYFNNIYKLPASVINKNKGKVRYISTEQNDNKLFNCSNIVLVNYIKGSETKLQSVSLEKALNILIPESWISPKTKNAKLFLNWLESIKFYELQYCDFNEAIWEFRKLFKIEK